MWASVAGLGPQLGTYLQCYITKPASSPWLPAHVFCFKIRLFQLQQIIKWRLAKHPETGTQHSRSIRFLLPYLPKKRWSETPKPTSFWGQRGWCTGPGWELCQTNPSSSETETTAGPRQDLIWQDMQMCMTDVLATYFLEKTCLFVLILEGRRRRSRGIGGQGREM